MRKMFAAMVLGVIGSSIALAAADPVTITGEGKCAKCSLKETPKCQNAIQVEENGKTVTYYLADNAVAKAYHKNVCTKTTKTTATGEVAEKDGKKILTATKVEEAK